MDGGTRRDVAGGGVIFTWILEGLSFIVLGFGGGVLAVVVVAVDVERDFIGPRLATRFRAGVLLAKE